MKMSKHTTDQYAELREKAGVNIVVLEKASEMDTPVYGSRQMAAAKCIRDLLAALSTTEERLREAREGLRKSSNRFLGIADELSRKPEDCLGIAGDGYNCWPIRDEMIDDAKKGMEEINAALSAQHPKAGAQEAEGESGGG
jgi:hypothetical protein